MVDDIEVPVLCEIKAWDPEQFYCVVHSAELFAAKFDDASYIPNTSFICGPISICAVMPVADDS